MSNTANGTTWSLEVARGQNVGRVFALRHGEIVLGSAPGEPSSINLADQEGSSPRRMAPRQAELSVTPIGLMIRDLDSPGGSFVNRQRLLPGQNRSLAPGDLIQLGPVQLRVIESVPAKPEATPAAPFSFVMAGGTVCRTWDDFLTVSSQRWEAMRDELASGRLGSFLVAFGRPSLAPPSGSNLSLDERLDQWLGSLPTTRPTGPELDVHPSTLNLRVTPGGGTIRRVVRVSNVGYRLLRSTARIEPGGLPWVQLPSEFDRRPFVSVEGLDLPIDFAIPETLPGSLSATLVIEGNGGSKRVAITLEAKGSPSELPSPGPFSEPGSSAALGQTFLDVIRSQSRATRLTTWPLILMGVRLMIGLAGGFIADGPTVEKPGLAGPALVCLAVGALGGAWLAIRRGGAREGFPGAFAGGVFGVVVASGLVAVCRAVEPWLGPLAAHSVALGLLWGGVGIGMALLSSLLGRAKT